MSRDKALTYEVFVGNLPYSVTEVRAVYFHCMSAYTSLQVHLYV